MPQRPGHARRATRAPGRRHPERPTAVARALDVQAPAPTTGTLRDALTRALDSGALARIVPHLAPEALHQIVAQCGLDACAELVAAASPAQLTALLDIDLWRRRRHGTDDELDPARFAEWIEALVDAGEALAARTVSAMDAEVVIAALARYLRVFDPAACASPVLLDAGMVDMELPHFSGLVAEIGGYVIRARRGDAWDALITLLAALADGHRVFFDRVMRGCRRLSDSEPEVDGLDNLLPAAEQMLHDVSAARDQRRSEQGYSSSADARAFLQMARTAGADRPPGGAANDPIAAAYFRDLEPSTRVAPAARVELEPAFDPSPDEASLESLRELLAAMPAAAASGPAALLEGPERGEPSLACIRRLCQHLFEHEPVEYLARTRELAFLANALLAGCSLLSRAFSAHEAFTAAVATCNLGLERFASEGETGRDLVAAFERGWTILFREVTMPVTDTLIELLGSRQCDDAILQSDLTGLRKTLEEHRRRGTPWQAGDALDPIAVLDTPAWAGLLGLMSECPVLRTIVPAINGRQAARVDPDAFEFISTVAQIAQVHTFIDRLGDLLFPPAAPLSRTTS